MKPGWDDFFMVQAFWLSSRSPDPATQHGAVIVDSYNRPLGAGYNGYPRGLRDDLMPKGRPHKYQVTLHAEDNAILNARGHNLRNSTLYVTGYPCPICFARIAQVGISRVVFGNVRSAINGEKEGAVDRIDVSEYVKVMIQDSGINVQRWLPEKGYIEMMLEALKNTVVDTLI